MADKLPKSTLKELDKIMVNLNKTEAHVRDAAFRQLRDFEDAGKLPIAALIDMSKNDSPTTSMYAIGALGRNGSAQAVSSLVELADRYRTGNVLMIETIVDALGETGDRSTAPVLLDLLGIQMKGLTAKLVGKLRKRKAEPDLGMEKRREHLTLPVIRALEKIPEARVVELLEDYIAHPDPVVRWHMINLLVNNNATGFKDRLSKMAESDVSELVREMAEIALGKISSLPPHLNN